MKILYYKHMYSTIAHATHTTGCITLWHVLDCRQFVLSKLAASDCTTLNS